MQRGLREAIRVHKLCGCHNTFNHAVFMHMLMFKTLLLWSQNCQSTWANLCAKIRDPYRALSSGMEPRNIFQMCLFLEMQSF